MDKLEAMRAFVATVDGGSLTAGGRALGRSLPTMVRTLGELEAELGVVLLRRTTRRMSLTDEGQLYLERCRRVLSEVADAEDLVRARHTPLRGRLRITAPVRFGSLHVSSLLMQFVRKHPEIELELSLLDRVVDIIDEGFDLAVRIGQLEDSSLVAREVGRMRTVVCASPSLLRRTGVPRHPKDLLDAPCIGFPVLRGRPWHFTVDGKDKAFSVRGRLEINQAEAAADAVVAGLGFGRFLHYQVQRPLTQRRLRVVLEAFEPAPTPVSLVFGRGAFVSPRLRALVDYLRPRLIDACGGVTAK